MRVRPLGTTGLTVSALSLGTVSLGVDYGIAAPGDFGRPTEDEAIALVRAAVDRGITLIDTAPAYGDAERIVGAAVGADSRVVIATKINPVEAGFSRPAMSRPALNRPALDASLEASRRALRRDILDIVQIHNATREMIADGAVTTALLDAQRRGVVRLLGASVYGEDAAMAVIEDGRYGVLQVAVNALDQRMLAAVIPAAERRGVGVIARSAFLKGALTPKAPFLPRELDALRTAAVRARDMLADGDWARLPDAAMRYCLSVSGISSVLTGARTLAELDAAVAAEASGPLSSHTMEAATTLAITDEQLVNPSYWPVA